MFVMETVLMRRDRNPETAMSARGKERYING